MSTAARLYGQLSILVNNAGIYIRKRIEETTEDDLDQIMAVNIKGVFLGTKHEIPVMQRAGGGSIINISSTAGLVGNPNGSSRLFTKATAVQHARDNIRCNSVHSSPIETYMLTEAAGGLEEAYRQRVPLDRFGITDDIAYGVLSTWTKVLPQFTPLENQSCISFQTVGESLRLLRTDVGMTHKPKMVANNTL